MSHKRKINIDGDEWTYHIGGWDIVLWDPAGKKHFTNHSVVTGLSSDVLERAEWKGYAEKIGANITPSLIRKYIKSLAG